MIVTTGPHIEGKEIVQYCGLVAGEAIFKDLFASVRDIVGGRSAGYERSLRQARETAVREMVEQAQSLGANAVIAIDIDYESIAIGSGGNMLMVSASGTAVKIL